MLEYRILMKMAKTPRRGMVKSEKAPPASRSWIGLPLPPTSESIRKSPPDTTGQCRPAQRALARTPRHGPPSPSSPCPAGHPAPPRLVRVAPRRARTTATPPARYQPGRRRPRPVKGSAGESGNRDRSARGWCGQKRDRVVRHATRARAVNPSLRLRFQLTA